MALFKFCHAALINKLNRLGECHMEISWTKIRHRRNKTASCLDLLNNVSLSQMTGLTEET